MMELFDKLSVLLFLVLSIFAFFLSGMHLMDAWAHEGGTDSAVLSMAFGVMALLLFKILERMETKVWKVKIRNSEDER